MSPCVLASDIGYEFVETVSVPVDGSSVTSQTSLKDGVIYKLQANGTFFVGGPGDSLADAEYADFSNPPASVIDLCIDGSVDLGIGINDFSTDTVTFPDWGQYQESHIYEFELQGIGQTISLSYHDCAYSDNSGELIVEIYQKISLTGNTWLLNANGNKYIWQITQDEERIEGTLQCINCTEVQTDWVGTIDTSGKVVFRRDLSPAGEDDNDQIYSGFLFSGTESGQAMAGLFGSPTQSISDYSYGWYAVKMMDSVDSDNDGIPDAVEEREGTNPGVKDNDVFSNNRLFVMQTYRDFLQREGDASGIEFWTETLNTAGNQGRISLITSFLDSPEFINQISTRFPNLSPAQATVTALYVGMLARDPDANGLNHWTSAFESGTPHEELVLLFIGSPEYYSRFLP